MYIGMRREPVTVVLLSIVTCGIYAYYWLYVTMEDINNVSERPVIDNPVLYLLLSIFCFPFLWVVWYKIDKELAVLAREEDIYYRENFALWLIFTFFFGVGMFVAETQIQGALNQIYERRYENSQM